MARMMGQRIVMESLLAEGVDTIFGNPGSTEAGFMDALQDYPQIKYYLGLHEGVVMAMALGYARASGKPAVAQLHIAPGTGNAMGMLWNAYKSGRPMVVLACQQNTYCLAQEPVMGTDLAGMVRPVTKWAVQVEKAADTAMILRRAFKVATTPPAGPVYVALPLDHFSEEVEATIGPSQRLHSHVLPDPEALQRARELLLQAERPVMLVGDGVAQSGAVPEAVKVAELLGARVFSNRSTELDFPTNHPLFLGSTSTRSNPKQLRQQLGGADVILAVGTSLFPLLMPATEPILTAANRVIHLDLNAWEIGKNYPVEVGMWADPRMGLRALGDLLEQGLTPETRQRTEERALACAQERARLRESVQVEARIGWDDTPISDPRLFSELKQVLPEGALVSDGSLSVSMRDHLDFSEPGSYFWLPDGACLGWVVGGALGMKLARPDRPVVAFVGDGDLLFGIQALWTAAHYHIPITCVVYNNRGYEAVKGLTMAWLRSVGRAERRSELIGMSLDEPALDLSTIARGFGVWGTRVEQPQDLRAALQEALALGRPALVDVLVEGSQARGARLRAAQATR